MTLRTLANLAAKAQRDYGEAQVPLDKARPLAVTPTGCIGLDWALRAGGYVRGRGYEIVGVKDAGKSTLVLTAAAIHQRAFPDRGVAYMDVEQTFDPGWATALGVDCLNSARKSGRWLHYYPGDSETASDMARDAAKSGDISLIIIDSVGGMESKKALEKDADKAQIGANAQVITRMSKHMATLCRRNDVVLLLVNQYRANVGSLVGGDISAGPKAMQHMTTSKIEMAQVFAQGSSRKEEFWGTEEVVGNMSRARVTRLKSGPRSRVCEFWIQTQQTPKWGPQGIDAADEHYRLGKQLGIIAQLPGGYYVLPGDEKFHGEDAVLAHLRANPAARDAIREQVPFEAPCSLEDTDD